MNNRIGYIFGDFDMLNINHLNILKQAKQHCDYLIVGVFSDAIVEQLIKTKPLILLNDRIEIIKSLKCVDLAIQQNSLNFYDVSQIIIDYKINILFFYPQKQKLEKMEELQKDLTEAQFDVTFLHLDSSFDNTFFNCSQKPFGTIGYTTGVFDMFHIGHLNVLKQAKQHCDYLIVGVSTDEVVEKYKHKKPIIPFIERKAIIEQVQYVDMVVSQETMDKFEAWQKLRFNYLFHGNDWKGSSMYNEIEEKLNKVGCKVIYLQHTDGISSTLLREKIGKQNN